MVVDREVFAADFLDHLRSLFAVLRNRRRQQTQQTSRRSVTGATRQFQDHRPYVAGDDYRNIDWRLVARMEKLFIRVFEDVQEYHVHMIVDTSRSMHSPFPEKRVAALRGAAALSYLALVNHHTVSLYGLSSTVDRVLRPIKGQTGITKILECLSELRFDSASDIPRALSHFRPVHFGRGLAYLFSDLLSEPPEQAVSAISNMRLWPTESHVIHLVAPAERRPDFEGEWRLFDAESGASGRFQLTRRDLDAYAKLFERFETSVRNTCMKHRIDHFPWTADLDFENVVVELLTHGSALADG